MTSPLFAFVFPGQGAQSVGMLGDIYKQYKEVKHTFDEASEAIGYDLWRLVQLGPQAELDKTIHTQPALLASSYAIYKILHTQFKVKPAILAGHSLGEYSALVCAEAITFNDAIKLVAFRGKYMQEAVPEDEGAMAAIIGLDEEVVLAICQEAIGSSAYVVSPANYNSLGQVVIAGHKVAVLKAIELAKEKKAKLAMLIPVSVPSHCKLMQKAALKLESLLNAIPLALPTIPIINNVDVVCYDTIPAIRDGLIRQLYMPVRWVETIQTFVKAGITNIVECGPGKILSGLNKRIDKNINSISTLDLASIEKTWSYPLCS